MTTNKRKKVPAITNSRVKLTKHSWPRNIVKAVECRKRDVVIRLTDWADDKEEPAYDVEVYDHGVYDWHLSQTFSMKKHGRDAAKSLAVELATRRLCELVR